MIRQFFCATAVVCLYAASLSAQTVRFDTNVGTFDMELNPLGVAALQGHVDNLIAYVESGRYNHTVINRAPENFVLQMGGFVASTLTLPDNFTAFPRVAAFAPVIVDADKNGQIDFDRTALKNTPGTVSLALGGGANGANTGGNSFFINISDNSLGGSSSLDARNFVPFAEISSLETINLIMALEQKFVKDSTPGSEGDLDANGASTASRDIPVLENDRLIIIERAFMVDTSEEMLAAALANATIFDDLAAVVSDDPPLDDPGGLLITPTVPEPSTMLLASAMAMLAAFRRR